MDSYLLYRTFALTGRNPPHHPPKAPLLRSLAVALLTRCPFGALTQPLTIVCGPLSVDQGQG